MPATRNHSVKIWLFSFAAIVGFLIVFGGFVRLTRSGLSIVEWSPISGSLPPLGASAWEAEFAKYQQTPEFMQVNFNMTLPEYRYIFYVEWIHRLLARLAGLFYALPLVYFVARQTIPWRETGVYILMGLTFVGQAFAGWYMVASGLLDRPSVSHLRLTVHLVIALALLGLALWVALGHQTGFQGRSLRTDLVGFSVAALLLVQIVYGGLTAGLKAGHLSDTWPLLFGKLVPPNLLPTPGAALLSPVTVLFIHRWLALAGPPAVLVLYTHARRQGRSPSVLRGLAWLFWLAVLQVGLGIFTVVRHIPIRSALLHQANAVVLFAGAISVLHLGRSGRPAPLH